MCSDLGETSHCCAGYSIVGAIFTVSRGCMEETVQSQFFPENSLDLWGFFECRLLFWSAGYYVVDMIGERERERDREAELRDVHFCCEHLLANEIYTSSILGARCFSYCWISQVTEYFLRSLSLSKAGKLYLLLGMTTKYEDASHLFTNDSAFLIWSLISFLCYYYAPSKI